jgi:hypothetical protein
MSLILRGSWQGRSTALSGPSYRLLPGLGDEGLKVRAREQLGRAACLRFEEALLMRRACLEPGPEAFRYARLQSLEVLKGHRVPDRVGVQVRRVPWPDRVGIEPASDPRCVVPVAEVVEPGRVVAFLAAVAVVPSFDVAQSVAGDERGAAIGEVFLVADDPSARVEVEDGGTAVVGDLVVEPRLGDVVGLASVAVVRHRCTTRCGRRRR